MYRMMGVAAVAFAFALASPLPKTERPVIGPVSSVVGQFFGAGETNAQKARAKARRAVRRTARRTARRVERRHERYRSLPVGCDIVLIGGLRHWYCGGIYYRELVDDGATVYVIVTP